MMFGDGEHGRDLRGRFGRALTKDEFDARMRERFGRLDKNGDNVVEASEMEAAVTDRMSRRFGGGEMGRGGAIGERLMRGFDANRDGKVSGEEVRAEFARRFAEADLNSDGRIDDADLPPLMRGRNVIAGGDVGMGPRGRGGMMRGIGFLREADANKDGVVTRQEVDAMADRTLARVDRNNDGVVDQADRDALRKEMVDYAVKRMAHRLGAGPDGKLTREQFLAKTSKRFARMDLNGDGTISRDERPGGHGRHGWRHGGGHHEGMGFGRGHHRMGDDGGTEPGDGRGPGARTEPPAKN
jgi:Ca2+-binding EF-hand superfamily protein